jgi:hypothetical protein
MTTSTPVPAAPSGRLRATRIILVSAGVLGLVFGAYVLIDSVAPARLPGLALWIGAAIVLHDAVIAPVVFGLGVLTRRGGSRVAGSIIMTVQAAIVLGSLMTLIVLPAVAAQRLGSKNPSVLPLDYAANLGLFWLYLALAAAIVSLWLYVRTRRANQRPSRTQS